MQEFESWRVKDLEARNKREKARPDQCHSDLYSPQSLAV